MVSLAVQINDLLNNTSQPTILRSLEVSIPKITTLILDRYRTDNQETQLLKSQLTTYKADLNKAASKLLTLKTALVKERNTNVELVDDKNAIQDELIQRNADYESLLSGHVKLLNSLKSKQ